MKLSYTMGRYFFTLQTVKTFYLSTMFSRPLMWICLTLSLIRPFLLTKNKIFDFSSCSAQTVWGYFHALVPLPRVPLAQTSSDPTYILTICHHPRQGHRFNRFDHEGLKQWLDYVWCLLVTKSLDNRRFSGFLSTPHPCCDLNHQSYLTATITTTITST